MRKFPAKEFLKNHFKFERRNYGTFGMDDYHYCLGVHGRRDIYWYLDRGGTDEKSSGGRIGWQS
jgi:hypothetical protein